MESIIATFHPRHRLTKSYSYECSLCEQKTHLRSNSYYCHSCDFEIHEECAINLMKESTLTMDHPEIHEHTLTFLRQKNIFRCVSCGEVRERKMNTYVCLQCNFFIHRNCINLPKVVKITRHSHRLFHTLQISYDGGSMSCRVCHQDLVYGYGGYTCIDKACDYKVHSHCATNSNIWDGKDIQGEPEEITLSEDVGSSSLLEEENGKRIRHFSHHHDLMKLSVSFEDEEESGRICQACIIPIDFESFWGCKQCDFALHNTCATLPRNLEHAFHRHRLTLHVDIMNIQEMFFTCSICKRESCGFMYRCSQEECEFKMDAKCASIVEPFNHVSHEHPLYISKFFYDREDLCRFCYRYTSTGATCYKCRDFCLDFKCATIPRLVRCNYGNHPLTLYFEDYYSYLTWCDICEKQLYSSALYRCQNCHTTQHIQCVIGRYLYMKPEHSIKVHGLEIEIASNRLSRPLCHTCHDICRDKLIFINQKEGVKFCSIDCIKSSTHSTK